MKEFYGVTVGKRNSRYGRQTNEYIIDLPETDGFPIYTSLFYSGIYDRLETSVSKVTYLTLKCYGGFNGDDAMDYYILEEEFNGEGCDEENFKEIYRHRKWEFCDAPKTFLAEKSGIH